MMNLIIGLCVGILAAAVLAVMWRVADRLRREIEAGTNEEADKISDRASRQVGPGG